MPSKPLFLVLPGAIAGTFAMRPRVSGSTGLTGADIALWLVVMDHHSTFGAAEMMVLEQGLITERFGRITRQRMHESMRRLMDTEVYLAELDRWVPAIVAMEEFPMPRTDPRVPVAPEWGFTVDPTLLRAWYDGVEAIPIRVACSQLRELTSRYAVAAWLRLLVWSGRTGVVPHDHWALALPKTGTGLRVDVPVDELGEFFGYDVHLPASKVAALFTTGSDNRPVVMRELVRVGVDYECVPVTSAWHRKPVAYRIRMGNRSVALSDITDGRWADVSPSRPKRRRVAAAVK